MSKTEEQYEWEVYQLINLGIDKKIAKDIIDKNESFKEGVWQYLVDHKRVQPNGYLGVQFYVRDREDFFKRVKARLDGFKRYDVEETEAFCKKAEFAFKNLKELREKQRNAENSKNIFIKTLAKLYKKYIIR